MAFATLISRVTGFTRIVLLAAILGAALSSSFSVANQLPNIVAALVLEATFTAIFDPRRPAPNRTIPTAARPSCAAWLPWPRPCCYSPPLLSVPGAPLLVRLMPGRTRRWASR